MEGTEYDETHEGATYPVFFSFLPGLFWLGYPTLAASKPPEQGTVLPQFQLVVPDDSEAQGYLGLSGSGEFTVSEINAPVVVIQIFSRY